MEIIIENALAREALLFVLELSLFVLTAAITGALLAQNRAMMYWYVMMAGLNVSAAMASMALLTGNIFQLSGSFFVAAMMVFSYFKQKKIICAETKKKRESAQHPQDKAVREAKAENAIKITNHRDYMP